MEARPVQAWLRRSSIFISVSNLLCTAYKGEHEKWGSKVKILSPVYSARGYFYALMLSSSVPGRGWVSAVYPCLVGCMSGGDLLIKSPPQTEFISLLKSELSMVLITAVPHNKISFSLILDGVKSNFQKSYSEQWAKDLFFTASHFSFKIKELFLHDTPSGYSPLMGLLGISLIWQCTNCAQTNACRSHVCAPIAVHSRSIKLKSQVLRFCQNRKALDGNGQAVQNKNNSQNRAHCHYSIPYVSGLGHCLCCS